MPEPKVAPVEPVAPIEPVQVDPSDAALAEMFDRQIGDEPKPVEPAQEPVESVEPVEPEEPVVPAEPKEPAEPVEPQVDDLEEMRARMDTLAKAKLEEWAGVQPPTPAPAPAPVVAPKQDMFGGTLIEDIIKGFNEGMAKDEEFLSPQEIDELVDKPGHFQVALNKTRRKTAEEILKIVPAIVDRIVTQYGATQRAVTDFYDINKDLNPYRNYVSVTFKKVMVQNKDKNLSSEELLKQTAETVRKDLRLAIPGATPPTRDNGKPAKPAFAGNKGSSRRPPKQEPTKEHTQQDYISDALKGFGI